MLCRFNLWYLFCKENKEKTGLLLFTGVKSTQPPDMDEIQKKRQNTPIHK